METKITCSKCRTSIPLEDVNVTADLALCRQCGQNWSYADLVDNAMSARLDFRNPPHGAWFRETGPNRFEVGATRRSALAFFLVPFMGVWSGISLGGIYGTQIYQGHFNPGMSLFGIPFLIVTVLIGATAVMAVCGKVTACIESDDGVLFAGVGSVGWRRRFNWRKVSGIRRTEFRTNRGSVQWQITFEGEKRLHFATGVKDERLDFMLAVLRAKWRESGH